jgi:O-Antigen ligase
LYPNIQGNAISDIPVVVSLIERPHARIGAPSVPLSLAVITFLYLMSGQALKQRDPIGTSADWHNYVQLASLLVSVALAAAVWARQRRFVTPPPSLRFFLMFGIIALFSSVRSFWPTLGIVKGCMFLLVLLLSILVCNTFSTAEVLRAVYYSVVGVFGVSIVLGVTMPDLYPLAIADGAGRQRLALFSYNSGDFAYLAGLCFFLGRLSAVRARWYFQLALVAITFGSGSRACTIALVVVWAAIKLYKIREIRDVRLPVVAVCLVCAITILGFLVDNGGGSKVGSIVYRGLEGFYGSGTVRQSPLELGGRVELWRAADGLFIQCVFLGFGFGGARDQLLQLLPWAGGAHNEFLEVFVTAGGVGLICFLVAWVFAIRSGLHSQFGRSTLPIHGFLLMAATTGPSFTIFQAFGVFLMLCIAYCSSSPRTYPGGVLLG